MKPSRLLRFGIVGSVVLAICCFTPALVLLLAFLGLSALTGYLDYVLLPALAACLIIVVYALVMRRHAN